MNTVTFLQGPLAGLQDTSLTGNVTSDDIETIADQFSDITGHIEYDFPLYITTRWHDSSSAEYKYNDWGIRIGVHFAETVDIVKDIDTAKSQRSAYATALRLPSAYNEEQGYIFSHYDDYIILFKNVEDITGLNIYPNEFIDIDKCSALILTGTKEAGVHEFTKITATNNVANHIEDFQKNYLNAQQAVWVPTADSVSGIYAGATIKLLNTGGAAILFGGWNYNGQDVTVTFYPNYGYSNTIPKGTTMGPKASISSIEERIAVLENLVRELEHQLETASKFFITR